MSGDDTSGPDGRARRDRRPADVASGGAGPGDSDESTSGRGERTTPAEVRRFLRRVGLGALIPGAGLIAAGRRWLGWTVFTVFVLAGAGVVVYSFRAGGTGLLRLGSDPERIAVIGAGLAGVAGAWLFFAVVGLYLLQPAGLRVAQRLLGALVVVLVASLVVAPLSLGSRYAFTQRDFIDSVFADEEKQHSLTIPKDATEQDPWAGQPRVNVLILGADSGDGREGTRADAIMVASIDTESGETALFSLPRNLQYVPMPEGPLREAYPDGYRGEPESEYWLYAVYKNLPAQFPEYFADIKDPGAEAMKLVVGEALGLEISYYVMVNLEGFKSLVDALGGVELDVPYPIPIGTKKLEWGGCSEPTGWIDDGENKHLDGYHALWFARARCGPPPVDDDYERMRRQRCVIGAIAAQADPFNVLRRYQQLASAAEDTMSTDIGRQRLDDFAELALRVQNAGIRSLPFTDEIVEYHDPDYELIREFVRDSLKPPEPATTPDAGDQPTGGADRPPGDGAADAETPDGEPPSGETPGGEATPDESEGAQSISAVC